MNGICLLYQIQIHFFVYGSDRQQLTVHTCIPCAAPSSLPPLFCSKDATGKWHFRSLCTCVLTLVCFGILEYPFEFKFFLFLVVAPTFLSCLRAPSTRKNKTKQKAKCGQV